MSHLFSPRSVVTLPLVPTTQRRGKLLEECAVTSPVTPDASRAPHELLCLTSTPLESICAIPVRRVSAEKVATGLVMQQLLTLLFDPLQLTV